MRRLIPYALLALLLVGTAPWFFRERWNTVVAGFPPWAFYCLSATMVFAIVVALCIEFLWTFSAGDDEGDG